MKSPMKSPRKTKWMFTSEPGKTAPDGRDPRSGAGGNAGSGKHREEKQFHGSPNDCRLADCRAFLPENVAQNETKTHPFGVKCPESRGLRSRAGTKPATNQDEPNSRSCIPNKG